jgi:hypothetical protein
VRERNEDINGNRRALALEGYNSERTEINVVIYESGRGKFTNGEDFAS